MDNLRAGVVEYEPLPFRYPLETYSEYVLRNVADYERMTADAVKEVMKQPTARTCKMGYSPPAFAGTQRLGVPRIWTNRPGVQVLEQEGPGSIG